MFPKNFVDDQGHIWHRADHLTKLERRNSFFRVNGPVMYSRPRKTYRAYVGRKVGFWGRLREILSLG